MTTRPGDALKLNEIRQCQAALTDAETRLHQAIREAAGEGLPKSAIAAVLGWSRSRLYALLQTPPADPAAQGSR